LVISGIKIIKNNTMKPQIINRVIKAPRARGKFHFFILILQSRSTSGRPIIDRTPETRIKTTMFRKNQAHAKRSRIPQKIRMYLSVVFIF
jgi:hypothetical protein